jgi:hypothetical protein
VTPTDSLRARRRQAHPIIAAGDTRQVRNWFCLQRRCNVLDTAAAAMFWLQRPPRHLVSNDYSGSSGRCDVWLQPGQGVGGLGHDVATLAVDPAMRPLDLS